MTTQKPCHLQIVIDSVTPSLNQYLGMHWQDRRKLRPRYAWAVRCALSEAVPGQEGPYGLDRPEGWTPPRMRVHIVSHRKALIDHDNLVGGAKPLVDALKDERVIRDDTREWAEIEYEQVVDRAGKTVIDAEPA